MLYCKFNTVFKHIKVHCANVNPLVADILATVLAQKTESKHV